MMGLLLLIPGAVALLSLLLGIPRCYQAILNDARIISKDPALQSRLEILYAYPGFWALFWYRLSHVLLERQIPVMSSVVPRLAMSLVRYATAIDIHPQADISSEGILIDHGAGIVVGATAVIGGGVTMYHCVTLGGTGKPVARGEKRHPTVGKNVVLGAGAKILGSIEIGDGVLVGANSVVTKPVPANHTAVGIPARILCRGSGVGKDVTGAAICELHQRLRKMERESENVVPAKAIMVGGVDSQVGETMEKPSVASEPKQVETAPPTPDRSRVQTTQGIVAQARSPGVDDDENQTIPGAVVIRSTRKVEEDESATLHPTAVPTKDDGFGSVAGVAEVLYGMQAIGQKSFGVAEVLA